MIRAAIIGAIIGATALTVAPTVAAYLIQTAAN